HIVPAEIKGQPRIAPGKLQPLTGHGPDPLEFKHKARSAWSMPPIYSTAVGMIGTAMSLITFITVLAKK
ncbi:MAG: hypothetical protein IIZ44_08570, partial [Muribaculaceae bacterium]|nr:hypothetical protein [Muribaculaceae bacterium]